MQAIEVGVTGRPVQVAVACRNPFNGSSASAFFPARHTCRRRCKACCRRWGEAQRPSAGAGCLPQLSGSNGEVGGKQYAGAHVLRNHLQLLPQHLAHALAHIPASFLSPIPPCTTCRGCTHCSRHRWPPAPCSTSSAGFFDCPATSARGREYSTSRRSRASARSPAAPSVRFRRISFARKTDARAPPSLPANPAQAPSRGRTRPARVRSTPGSARESRKSARRDGRSPRAPARNSDRAQSHDRTSARRSRYFPAGCSFSLAGKNRTPACFRSASARSFSLPAVSA